MSKYLIIVLAALSFLLVGHSSVAANNYAVQRIAEQYDSVMCVANYRNYCVDQICHLVTDRDCQPQCLIGAAAKCEAQENQ